MQVLIFVFLLDQKNSSVNLVNIVVKYTITQLFVSDNKFLNNIASQIPEQNLPSKYKTLLYDNCTKILYNKLEKQQKLVFKWM